MYSRNILNKELPEILQRTIDEFITVLKSPDAHKVRDLYESEIDSILKCCDQDLTQDEFYKMRDYYVFRGIDNDNEDR